MSALCRALANPHAPQVPILARAHCSTSLLEVPTQRRLRACQIVPQAPVRARPLQNTEVTARRRLRARESVPRAAVRARTLQYLEVAACRRCPTRAKVPRCAALAQHIQLLELSTPRRCLTKQILIRQVTSPFQALQPALTSELYGFILVKLLKRKSRRHHRVAHRTAHRWEPCEICGIVKALRSQDVRDDEVVGEAGKGFSRDRLVRGCRYRSISSILGVGGHHSRGMWCASSCVVRVVVVWLFLGRYKSRGLKSSRKLEVTISTHLQVRRLGRFRRRNLSRRSVLLIRCPLFVVLPQAFQKHGL